MKDESSKAKISCDCKKCSRIDIFNSNKIIPCRMPWDEPTHLMEIIGDLDGRSDGSYKPLNEVDYKLAHILQKRHADAEAKWAKSLKSDRMCDVIKYSHEARAYDNILRELTDGLPFAKGF